MATSGDSSAGDSEPSTLEGADGQSGLGDETILPSVNERLGHLRPSRELLEYYRQKIAEYDGEYEKLLKKLDKYKCTYEKVHQNHWEIRQREEEIAELQKALSDMQVFLFQEREQVLRLYAENDRLKIRELQDRKKIQHLLSLTQPVSEETTYFLKQPPGKVVVHQRRRRAPQHSEGRPAAAAAAALDGRGPGGHKSTTPSPPPSKGKGESEDYENLLLTVEALKAQLEEQTRLCKEQVDSLLEDRRVRMEEAAALHDRDTERVKALTDQLHMAQSMLYDSTKDYLDLKYESRARERGWVQEKDQLLRQMDHYREQLDESQGIDPVLGMNFTNITPRGPSRRGHGGPGAVRHLQLQLQQAQQLADNYREQCIGMEEELCRLREETDASKDMFKQRSDKMAKRLGLMNSRYENLEKRRSLEIEGYKSDIKLLRQRLKQVEKQLYKLTITLSGDQDMQILTHVRQTAKNSKKLVGDLQNLKAKVYSLENDARHVHDL